VILGIKIEGRGRGRFHEVIDVSIYEGIFTFFLDEKSNKKIKPKIFLHQKSSDRFFL
jgi:hypothetical protein